MRFEGIGMATLLSVLSSLSLAQGVLIGAVGTIQLRPDAEHGKGIEFAHMSLGEGSHALERQPMIKFRTKDNGDIINGVGEFAEPRFTVYFKDENEQEVSALVRQIKISLSIFSHSLRKRLLRFC